MGNFAEYDRDLDVFVKEVVLPDCPPPLFALGHSMGAAVLLRAAYQGRRWFDRIVLSGPMIDLHGAAGSRFARHERARAADDGAWVAVRPGRRRDRDQHASVSRQQSHLGSGPLRAHGRDPGGRADTRHRLAHGWLAECRLPDHARFRRPNFASRLRQPLLLVAAGQDRIVSTPAISAFATRLRAGSHLVIPGARHEIPDGAGSLSRTVLGGVRRVRAGHAVERSQKGSALSARSCAIKKLASNLTRLRGRAVAGRDDPPTSLGAGAFPGGDSPRAFDDRDERHDVVLLQSRLDHKIDWPAASMQ